MPTYLVPFYISDLHNWNIWNPFAKKDLNAKGTYFLMSLKSLLEAGKGSPNPDDIKIDNRN